MSSKRSKPEPGEVESKGNSDESSAAKKAKKTENGEREELESSVPDTNKAPTSSGSAPKRLSPFPINPYSRDNPPLPAQLFIPARTKNRGNFLCIRLIGVVPPSADEDDKVGPSSSLGIALDRKRAYTSDDAVGAWCTVCRDAVWWRKGESNGISRHMFRFHSDLLREAGIERDSMKGKGEQSNSKSKKGAVERGSKYDSLKHRGSDPPKDWGDTCQTLSTPSSPADQAKFDALTLMWVHHHLRPMSIVEDSGLHNLISFASSMQGEPTLCSNRHTLAMLSSRVHDHCTKRMSQLIQDQSINNHLYYSMTIDATSSRNGLDDGFASYFVASVHFVSTDFALHTLHLDFGSVEDQKGDDLHRNVVEKWGMEKVKPAVVLYGSTAFNDKANEGVASSSVHHIPLFGLSMHLICGPFYCLREASLHDGHSDDVADFSFDERASKVSNLDHAVSARQAVSKVRKLVVALKKKGPTCSLKSQDGETGAKTVDLGIDIPNRWSTTHKMLELAIQQQSALEELADDPNTMTQLEEVGSSNSETKPYLNLTSREWALARGIWILLTPVQSLVESLSSETYLTVVYAYPFLCRVKNILNLPGLFRGTEEGLSSRKKCGNFMKESLEGFLDANGKQDYFDSVVEILEACQCTLRDEFIFRFDPLNKFCLWASMLDPRLRKLNHCTEAGERHYAKQSLLSEMVALAKETVLTQQPAETVQPVEDKLTSSSSIALNDMFGDVFDDPDAGTKVDVDGNEVKSSVGISSSDHQYQQAAETELVQYLAAPRVHKNISAFHWWRDNRGNFPMLARAARKWLSVVSISSAHDRIVSHCGFVGKTKTQALDGCCRLVNEERQRSMRFALMSLRMSPEEVADVIAPSAAPGLKDNLQSSSKVAFV